MAYNIFQDSGETLEQLDRKLKGYTYMDVEERYQHVLNEITEVNAVAAKYDMAIEGLITTANAMESINGDMPKAALEAYYATTAFQAEQLTGNFDMVGVPPLDEYTYGDNEFKELAIEGIKDFAKSAAKRTMEVIRKIVQRLRDELLNSRGAVAIRMAMSRRALKQLKEAAKNVGLNDRSLPKASYHKALGNAVWGNATEKPKLGVISNGKEMIAIATQTQNVVDAIAGKGGAMEYTTLMIHKFAQLLSTDMTPDEIEQVGQKILKLEDIAVSKVGEINRNIPGVNGHVPIIQKPKLHIDPANGVVKNAIGQSNQRRTQSYNVPKDKMNGPNIPMPLTKSEMDELIMIVEDLVDDKNKWSSQLRKHVKLLTKYNSELETAGAFKAALGRSISSSLTRTLMAEAFAIPPIVLPIAKVAMQYIKQTLAVCSVDKVMSNSKELVVV